MIDERSQGKGYGTAALPAKECDQVKAVRAEYYLQDIYGNELVINDRVAEADRQPAE